MNAHFNTTTAAEKANIDVALIQVGSMVYVSTDDEEYTGSSGFQVVTAVDGDLLTGDAGEEKFLRRHVVAHLADALVVGDDMASEYPKWTTNNPIDDSLLVGWGRELAELAPEAARRWKVYSAAREQLDAAIRRIERRTGKRPPLEAWATVCAEGEMWEAARVHHAEVGNRAYLLLHAVNWSVAYTLQGVAAKAVGLYYEQRDDQGGNGPLPSEIDFVTRLTEQLMNDLAEIADRVQPSRPVGKLADLIADHRAALVLFEATCRDEETGRTAMNERRGNNPIVTPCRIREGKVIARVEVVGDQDHDLRRIREEHEQWKRGLNFKSIEQISPVAALAISQIVEASLAECLRLYEIETKPVLAETNAEYVAALAIYNAANASERDALFAVARYAPQSLADVAEQVRYLAEIDDMDGSVRQAFCDALGAMNTEHEAVKAA